MRPIDFILFDGGSAPNTPALEVKKAMVKPLIILGAAGQFKVLSYYMSGGRLCIDIEVKQ